MFLQDVPAGVFIKSHINIELLIYGFINLGVNANRMPFIFSYGKLNIRRN